MNKSRKDQIAWWVKKVYEQSQEYADVIDPKRTGETFEANQLDGIAGICNRLYFHLTKQTIRS